MNLPIVWCVETEYNNKLFEKTMADGRDQEASMYLAFSARSLELAGRLFRVFEQEGKR